MTDNAAYTFAPDPLDDEVFGGAPRKPVARIALALLVVGGGVGAYFLFRHYSAAPAEPDPISNARQREVDPQNVTRDLARVMNRMLLPPEANAAQAEAMRVEQQRLAARRAEITARLRGEGFARGAEEAAAELANLELGFTGTWPRSGQVDDAALAAAVLENSAGYRALLESLNDVSDRLAGTRVGDDVAADAACLNDAFTEARASRLDELKQDAESHMAAGEFVAALRVYSPERFPIALIPRLDYLDAAGQADYEAAFHQQLQAQLVYPIALALLTPKVKPLQQQWDGAAIVACVNADTLRNVLGDLPSGLVDPQLERARQHFLTPFSQRFYDLVRETRAFQPADAAGVPDALAQVESHLDVVKSWGLPEFTQRARGIVDGYRKEFAARFGEE